MFGPGNLVLCNLYLKYWALEGGVLGKAYDMTIQDLELSKAMVDCFVGNGKNLSPTQRATRRAFLALSTVPNRPVWWAAKDSSSLSTMRSRVVKDLDEGLQHVRLETSELWTCLDQDRLDAKEVGHARTTIAQLTADLAADRQRNKILESRIDHLEEALVEEDA